MTPVDHLATQDGATSELSRVTRKVNGLLTGSDDDSDPTSLDEIETALLKGSVRQAQGNLSAAARRLGITRAPLVYRMKSRNLRV